MILFPGSEKNQKIQSLLEEDKKKAEGEVDKPGIENLVPKIPPSRFR